MSKPKIGFYWCASCGGCEESVVDLAEDILPVLAAVEFAIFPVAMDFKREDVEELADKEMAACLINGAIRSSEQLEMAELLRAKSQVIIAYGSCSCSGGIPALANLSSKKAIMDFVYHEAPSVHNPDKTEPQLKTLVNGNGESVTLPLLHEQVRSLDQVIDVDYFLPGCAPPSSLLKSAIEALLTGNLPPKGTVLAPDKALCSECPRLDSKPDQLQIATLKRVARLNPEPDLCLLAQGFFCQGPGTRAGCSAACIKANAPCGGCMGPLSVSGDSGAACISALGGVLSPFEEAEIDKSLEGLPDPVGTFYRYSLSHALLFRKNLTRSDHGTTHRS